MNKSRLINSFLVANLTIALVWPQTSLAFSLFGPSDAEKNILFLQGYNAGIARTVANDEALGLPTNTNVKTNTARTTTSVLSVASSTYVTNPMSSNLDINNFHVYNASGLPIFVDNNLGLARNLSVSNAIEVGDFYGTFGDSAAVSVSRSGTAKIGISSYVNGPSSQAGSFIVDNANGYAIYARTDNANSYAGYFIGNTWVRDGDLLVKSGSTIGYNFPGKVSAFTNVANKPAGYFISTIANGVALRAIATSTGSQAGLFEGKVQINNGGLNIDHGNIVVESANEGNVINARTLVNNSTAIRGIATGENSFAGAFVGRVDIDGDMLTINNPYSYSVTTPPTASVGLGVSGNNMGIFSLSYGSAEDSVGVLGRGVNGVKGEAAYGNGKAIWGVTWPDEYPNSYAGYFDGRVVATGGLRTNKICVGNNLEDPGTCLQNEGIVSTAANDSIVGNALSNSGTGVLGQGFKGVYGRAVGNNSIGIYGAVATGATNALAARFDGETEISAGNLNFSNNLNPRIDVNTDVASTLGINFNYNANTGRMDDWGVNSLSDFVFTSNNRLGIGTVSPNANFHIKTASGNAEVDIQSGNNTHWGIYQASTGGALNFWHGDNRLTINDKGITTNGICLGKTCVTKWEDLKAILNPTPTTQPTVLPSIQR